MPTRPVGYVLKMYPRFSETFILNELLELERQGAQVHIFSLRSPDDGVFHADVARARAGVTYVPTVALRNALSFVEPYARLPASRLRAMHAPRCGCSGAPPRSGRSHALDTSPTACAASASPTCTRTSRRRRPRSPSR